MINIFGTKSIWVEVGRIFEPYYRKHGGVPLLNAYIPTAVMMPGQDTFILSDDGIHFRRIGGQGQEQSEESEDRIVFTFSGEQAEQAFSEIEAEIRRNHFNTKEMEDNGNEPKDLHWAVSFVDQMSDLYDEEGWRELTPGLSGDLDKSIQTLKRYRNRGQWVDDMLENALSLRELMSDIRVWKHYR